MVCPESQRQTLKNKVTADSEPIGVNPSVDGTDQNQPATFTLCMNVRSDAFKEGDRGSLKSIDVPLEGQV